MHKFVLGFATPLFLAGTLVAQTAAKPAATTPGPSSTAAKPAAPAHPITAAQAHELMQLTGTAQVKDHLIENIMGYFKQAFPPFVPADVSTDLRSSLEKMDIEAPTVATYQRYLSTEDADKVIEFYKTPAGKDFLKSNPLILNEIQQQALKSGHDTAQAVLERHKTEIETAQKAYQQQHSPAAPPTLGPGAPSGSAPSGTSTPKQPQ